MNPSIKILYIEDDPLDVKLVRETFDAEGLVCDLTAVDTRPELIAALETGQFEVILSDYRLPGFGDRESLLLARARRPEVPFIYVTGALGEEEAIELLKRGATDYVLKSRLSRLGPAVQRALDEAGEQQRRRTADRELRESNLRLTGVLESFTGLIERLFENTHVLIVHVDANCNFLRVNQAYAQAAGKSLDYFPGRNYFELYPNPATRAMFQNVIATGEPCFARAKPWEPIGPQAGRPTFWDWSLQPVRNEHGQVEGLLLFLVDVSRRKQTQKARVLSERRYRELVENVDCIIMRWKPDGTVTYANHFARHFFGYSAREWLGVNAVGTIFPQTDGMTLPPAAAGTGAGNGPGEPETGECECRRRDGSRVWIRWTFRAIRNTAGEATEVLCVGNDITDRKQKELEMQRIQQGLRAFARTMGTTLHGRAVSPGLVEGTALLFQPPDTTPAQPQPIAAGEVASEIDRFDRALAASIHELELIRERVSSQLADEEMAIVEVHMTMLQDPAFAEKCRQRVRGDLVKIEHVVATEIKDLETMLQGLEHEAMRERSADVRDIGRRVLSNLQTEGAPPVNRLASLPPETILVAEQLLPSDTLQLDRQNVVAFVTERNGPASHVAILARALGIPAVCDVRKATALLATGDRLLVDAEAGTVTVAPTRSQAARFAARRAQYNVLTAVMATDGPDHGCVTQDGVSLHLFANIGRPDEASLVRQYGLEGVGLFRSEFLFLDVERPPDLEAQVRAYTTVAQIVRPDPVVIRTMDLGGDKMPKYAQMDNDLKLRLGKRGLAYALAEKSQFRTQLQGILQAAGQGNVKIMFPMVLGVADLREARHLLDELMGAGWSGPKPLIGAMIETPSAVFAIREILEMVDFISLGTNDLAQFILAIDRASPESTGALSFLQPSVLRATDQVIRAAAEQAVELSVCGEAAGELSTACLLVGLGVRNLSMSPLLATRMRQALRQMRASRAELAARDALSATTRDDVQAIVTAALRDMDLAPSG